jgi:hypothetical protein
MNDTKTLNWFPVDTDSMPATAKAKWAALQKANAAQKAAREDFEATFTAAAKKADRLDADVELAFGYRFGRLAIAKVDKADVKAKASAKPKFTF